ncbi:Oidioi.mRNA.OKI2018_I69.chr2.g5562.t1.cds [Oikopleura dioica]|uniref:Oidioi.mRNA.OKI2018_I69.chr2.g5562.t1.cds n=1 Tax=Oikopleura dioica TaxID=34765 RepID=A0ABN7T6M9_OIKDI|nr:Oidioi.mRNA.OKI2018_I69.chr2.g5562.t1.cds [Oikopleura dioica]
MTLRTTRAGTRNLVKEEIKRVKKQLEKVRKWEKKWVVLGDGGLRVYRWVPKKVSESEEQEKEKTSPLKAILKQQMAEKAATLAGTGTKDETTSGNDNPPADGNAQKSSPEKSTTEAAKPMETN